MQVSYVRISMINRRMSRTEEHMRIRIFELSYRVPFYVLPCLLREARFNARPSIFVLRHAILHYDFVSIIFVWICTGFEWIRLGSSHDKFIQRYNVAYPPWKH